MINDQDRQIDPIKLNRIKYKILKIEHEHLKTREVTNDKMAELIKQIIIDEINRIV